MHVAAVLKRLILGKAPKCAFVTGHYERNIFKTGEREFAEHTARKLNRESLVNMGFDVDTISLDKEDIPPDLTTLVLADPKSELSVVCQEKIRKYLSSGGNMFILGEPGKQQMVNPVLQQLGVSLMDGVLVSQHKEEMPDIQKVHYTRSFLSIRKDPSGKKINAEQEKDAFLFMPRSAAIDYTDTAGFTYTPLLMTEKGISWLKKGKLVADSAMVEFRKEEGDVWEQGGFVTLLAMHRQAGNKEQRVVVAGDADFLGNASKVQHKHGILLHSWLGDGAFPVYIPRTGPPDILLTISGNAAERLKLFYVWILPGFILLAGTVLLIRRKRK
jgi:ABC-2 type transport system permease protein